MSHSETGKGWAPSKGDQTKIPGEIWDPSEYLVDIPDIFLESQKDPRREMMYPKSHKPANSNAYQTPENPDDYLHSHYGCNNCTKMLLNGRRYTCASCPDFDLCGTCIELFGIRPNLHKHSRYHFIRIKDSRLISEEKMKDRKARRLANIIRLIPQ